MTSSRHRRQLLLIVAALVGCAAAPLGDDWERLGPADRDARATATLRELFASRVDVEGEPTPDPGREVLSVDLAQITYVGHGGPSTLRWADVEAIEQDEHPGVPGRPVDLRLYVRRDSPSADTVRDLVEPRTPLAGLLRAHLSLRWRPRGARPRLIASLEHARGRTAPSAPAPITSDVAPASSTTATTTTSTPDGRHDPARLDDLEATLRRLRAWRDDGLISDEEYEAKRAELLRGL